MRKPPDSLHLRAAQGWLELGKLAEANDELGKITARLRAHPDVLKRAGRFRGGEEAGGALDIAAALVRFAPEEPLDWVRRSGCPHELKRTAEARDNLLAVAERLPDEAIMRYNLVCWENVPSTRRLAN